jgi:hypothetical protein
VVDPHDSEARIRQRQRGRAAGRARADDEDVAAGGQPGRGEVERAHPGRIPNAPGRPAPAPAGTNQVEAAAMFCAVNGILRTRLPVPAKIAFATAGPTSAVAGSPMPPGFSMLLASTMSICGVSWMRMSG